MGHRVEAVLDQLIESPLVKSRLILSLLHGSPPKISLILKVEYCEPYPPFLKTLKSIKQLLYALNLVFEGFGVRGANVHRWVVTRKSLEHIGVILLDLPLPSLLKVPPRVRRPLEALPRVLPHGLLLLRRPSWDHPPLKIPPRGLRLDPPQGLLPSRDHPPLKVPPWGLPLGLPQVHT